MASATLRNKRILGVVLFVMIITAIAIIAWAVEQFIPARDYMLTATPTPSEHFHFTLPYHEERHRQTYLNNSFIQILHHTHNMTNASNCWVCGMLPGHQKKGGTPLIPLPFSHNGSCNAWYTLLFMLRWPTKGGLLFRLNKVCYNDKDGYPRAEGTKFEWEEYRPDNVSSPRIYTNHRCMNVSSTHTLTVINTRADLCVRNKGTIPVGKSECNITLTFDTPIGIAFIASRNTYFICGTRGYDRLPLGWLGTCYISFVLPPVFIAPPMYHNDFVLYHDFILNRMKRSTVIDDIDQTDTSLQQYVDFNLGLFSFVGAALNSRKIRRLTRVVEAVANETVSALGNITEELQIARIVTLQNRMVLDVLLADRGGACRIIGSSCCVYIPDNSPSVYESISKLHKIAAEIHPDQGTWTFSGWFWTLLSTWGWKLLTILCVIIGILFSLCLCIQCGPMLCSMCVAACIPSKYVTSKAEQMSNREITKIMMIDINDEFPDYVHYDVALAKTLKGRTVVTEKYLS